METGTDFIRPGFNSVTPYLIVDDALALIAFMRDVFDAQEIRRDLHKDGSIMNVEMKLGSSVVELSQGSANWPSSPCSLHVYVADTDAAYARALAAGATVLYEPADMPYGERSAGVRDSNGNNWFIATYQGE